jgi:predicted lipoprotein with Yx(FWY)xxD motif
MNAIRTSASLVVLTAVTALILVACGGGGDSGAASAPASSSSAQTVSVASVEGVGDVLVDADGSALYAADQEVGGMVLCTDGCATIWDPLTVSGEQPTAGDGLSGRLGVAERPDGAQQVTFNGRLLYRFVEDPSPRTVTGNGFADTFDGQPFTWHVATPDGISTSSTNSSPSSDGYGF